MKYLRKSFSRHSVKIRAIFSTNLIEVISIDGVRPASVACFQFCSHFSRKFTVCRFLLIYVNTSCTQLHADVLLSAQDRFTALFFFFEYFRHFTNHTHLLTPIFYLVNLSLSFYFIYLFVSPVCTSSVAHSVFSLLWSQLKLSLFCCFDHSPKGTLQSPSPKQKHEWAPRSPQPKKKLSKKVRISLANIKVFEH